MKPLIRFLPFLICAALLFALNSCRRAGNSGDTVGLDSTGTAGTSESTSLSDSETTVGLRKFKPEEVFSSDAVFVEHALTFAIERGVLWLSAPELDVPEHDGLPNYSHSVYGMGYNLRHEAERLAESSIKYYAVIINVNASPWNSVSVKDYPPGRTEKYEGKSIPEWFAYLDSIAGTEQYAAARKKALGFVLERERQEIEDAGLEFCCLVSSSEATLTCFAFATEEQIAELMNIGTDKNPSDAPYLLTIANKITVMNSFYQTNAEVAEAVDRFSKPN